MKIKLILNNILGVKIIYKYCKYSTNPLSNRKCYRQQMTNSHRLSHHAGTLNPHLLLSFCIQAMHPDLNHRHTLQFSGKLR